MAVGEVQVNEDEQAHPPAAPAPRPQGTLELSADKDPALFKLARVAMGLLGVVTEVTLQVRGASTGGTPGEPVACMLVLAAACNVQHG